MDYPNAFNQDVADKVNERLAKLTNETSPQWGKMNAAQMLAHLNVAYDIAYDKISTKKPGFLMNILLKNVIKPVVVGPKPYKKNSRTAPVFLIADERVFEEEKDKFITNMQTNLDKGESFFDGKENPSFGVLTLNEWNTMFYKHLDHHFNQFNI